MAEQKWFQGDTVMPLITRPTTCLVTGTTRSTRGWTLTELMVALAVAATVAALAIPGYQTAQRQARRSDAQSALLQLQMDQARWRTSHDSHAAELNLLGWRNDLSPAGHYQISIEDAGADGFTVKATPRGAQALDSACNPMRLQLSQAATVQLTSGTSPDRDPARCWRQ